MVLKKVWDAWVDRTQESVGEPQLMRLESLNRDRLWRFLKHKDIQIVGEGY